jgi:RNA methyltransferase, TrmH family
LTRRTYIASRSNERLKAVRRLARTRPREVFVAEGARAVRAALEAGAEVRELFAAPELFLGDGDFDLVAAAELHGVRVVELGREAFLSISRSVRADGLVAVVTRPSTALARLALPEQHLLVVAGAIEKAGNLGTIVRTAAAAGADALIAADARTDIFHSEVVRGSVGAIFHLPVAVASGERIPGWLRERDVQIVVATPEAARPYWAADYTGAAAIVVGNERCGLTNAWRRAADEAVAIPLPGPADSLNVAVATGIVLFEAARQRVRRAGAT